MVGEQLFMLLIVSFYNIIYVICNDHIDFFRFDRNALSFSERWHTIYYNKQR